MRRLRLQPEVARICQAHVLIIVQQASISGKVVVPVKRPRSGARISTSLAPTKPKQKLSKLLLPYEPTEVLNDLANHKAANPDFNIEQVHFFPLGGIKTNAEWAIANGGAAGRPAAAHG